ncbi:MAG: hypothetical protein ACI9R3_002542 [Verrucomicrobiales bacterium]|jgi:hypothetical protein
MHEICAPEQCFMLNLKIGAISGVGFHVPVHLLDVIRGSMETVFRRSGREKR